MSLFQIFLFIIIMFAPFIYWLRQDRKSKDFYLIRGVPGCGKSTLADSIVGANNNIAADDYFYILGNGEYAFSFSELGNAHAWCQAEIEKRLKRGVSKVAVSNTNTYEKDVTFYKSLAEKYGYRVHVIVVENRHGGVNGHDVPEKSLEKMANRLMQNIKLK